MSESLIPRVVRSAAVAAADRPAFLGWVLSRYGQAERLDDAGLAHWLGIDPSRLAWLGLCRRPRTDSFVTDVATVSARFGVDPSRLATAIRQVDALAALATAPAEERGVLAAARDREAATDLDRDAP